MSSPDMDPAWSLWQSVARRAEDAKAELASVVADLQRAQEVHWVSHTAHRYRAELYEVISRVRAVSAALDDVGAQVRCAQWAVRVAGVQS